MLINLYFLQDKTCADSSYGGYVLIHSATV